MKPNIVKIGDKVIKEGCTDPIEIKSIAIERWHGPDNYTVINSYPPEKDNFSNHSLTEISVPRFKKTTTLICWLGGVNSQDKAEYFRADEIERVA